MKILILALLFTILSPVAGAQMSIHCAHEELCKLLSVISTEQKITDLKTNTLVHMSGDPHEYEPTSAEIKSLINAPILLSGPFELNPWIKKINFQRSKSPTAKTITLAFHANDYKLYEGASGEAISHFWLYPKVYCSLKSKLEMELTNLNLPIKTPKSCDGKSIEDELKKSFAKINLPIVLTHNALLPLLNNLKGRFQQEIIAIKGSGHHEEASPVSVKKMYDALKAPRVIWIVESGINIPPNILNKMRKTDIIIKIDTARSQGQMPFSNLIELTNKFNEVSKSL